MSSGSKFSWMTDQEFLNVARGIVGVEVLDEALRRLESCMDDEAEWDEEREELVRMHEAEVFDLNEEIYRLKNHITSLGQASEYA